MKEIRLLALFAAYVVMSLAIGSCKEAAEEVKMPEVTLSKGDATSNSLTFTVEPAYAEKCSWICTVKGSELPNANQILSAGTEISAVETSTVTVSELEPSKEYVILAAVSGVDGTVVSEQLIMATLEDTSEPEPEKPYEMTFTEVVCDNQYADPGEFYVVMKDAKGEHDLKLDFFADKEALALPAGTYNIGKGEEPYMLNDGYTFLNIKLSGSATTTVVMFREGTVEVAKDGKKYTLDINLVSADDGKVYKSRFEGEIKNMPVEPSEVIGVTMSTASLHPNSEVQNGYYLVKLNDDSGVYEMSLQFYSEAGSGVLPAGTYTFGDSKTPGTVGTGSCLDIRNKGSNYFRSGTVTVTMNGDTYKFETELIGRDDDRLFKVNFEGKINGMETEKKEVIELVADEALLHFNSKPSEGNFYVKLNDKAWSFDMALDFKVTPGSGYLPAGVYSIEDGALTELSYIEIYSKKIKSFFSSGQVEVSREGDVYTIVTSLESKTESVILKVSYKGVIKDMPSESPESYEFVMDAARLHPNSDPAAGYFLVKLHDTAWSKEMSLQFYSETGSEVLPAGTYIFGDSKAPGTIGTGSCLDIQNKGSNYFKSGKVVVTKEGEIYKFEMELTGRDDNRLFKGTFEGKIS